MPTIRWTAIFFSLLTICVGCERPPVPAPTQQSGPPQVVIVELKSDKGKELLAARKKYHDNFVPEKIELPPARVEPPATVAPPAAPVGTPAAPPAAAPTAPPGAAPTAPVVAPTGAAGQAAAPPAGNVPHVAAADIAGRKGKEFGSGLIATPIGAYFGTRERVAMMQITEQLKLWSTQHDRAPRDFKEFMEVIVKPASIKLPELRPGERYNFYPQEGPHGTLVVEQPPEPKK